MKITAVLICLMLLTTTCIQAGPAAYGLCQAGCAAVVMACYSAAGFVWGTVTAGVGAPAAIIACNAAFGKCSATCATLLLAPTP